MLIFNNTPNTIFFIALVLAIILVVVLLLKRPEKLFHYILSFVIALLILLPFLEPSLILSRDISARKPIFVVLDTTPSMRPYYDKVMEIIKRIPLPRRLLVVSSEGVVTEIGTLSSTSFNAPEFNLMDFKDYISSCSAVLVISDWNFLNGPLNVRFNCPALGVLLDDPRDIAISIKGRDLFISSRGFSLPLKVIFNAVNLDSSSTIVSTELTFDGKPIKNVLPLNAKGLIKTYAIPENSSDDFMHNNIYYIDARVPYHKKVYFVVGYPSTELRFLARAIMDVLKLPIIIKMDRRLISMKPTKGDVIVAFNVSYGRLSSIIDVKQFLKNGGRLILWTTTYTPSDWQSLIGNYTIKKLQEYKKGKLVITKYGKRFPFLNISSSKLPRPYIYISANSIKSLAKIDNIPFILFTDKFGGPLFVVSSADLWQLYFSSLIKGFPDDIYYDIVSGIITGYVPSTTPIIIADKVVELGKPVVIYVTRSARNKEIKIFRNNELVEVLAANSDKVLFRPKEIGAYKVKVEKNYIGEFFVNYPLAEMHFIKPTVKEAWLKASNIELVPEEKLYNTLSDLMVEQKVKINIPVDITANAIYILFIVALLLAYWYL